MRDIRESLQASLGDAYRIERELPRGGMSRVFAAHETALGRTVVLKVLSPELAETLSAERFKREITLAARLQHPHIVPLLATGQAGDSLFYTMPLIQGESLRERMSRERPMPIAYDRVPWAIYCHPEVAFAGPSEEAARAAGHDVVVAKHQFRANSRAQILGELDGLVKVIAKRNADGSAGQVLGVHMVGPWVTEQLSGGYLAVNWEATVAEVAEFIQPHPSLTELFGETMLSLTGRSLNA